MEMEEKIKFWRTIGAGRYPSVTRTKEKDLKIEDELCERGPQ